MAAALETDDHSDEAIHRMETVPPPVGEDDAYSAATKIGPMARGLVEALMAKAQAEENSSLPPPVSATRAVSVPKAARVPTVTAPALSSEDDGDLFEPTALYTAPAAPPARARCDADWTKAPTLMDMSVVPVPVAPATAPSLAPRPAPLAPARRSTLPLEIAIFLGTFLLVAIPAALAYLYWGR